MTSFTRWFIAVFALLLLVFWYRSNLQLPEFWDGLVGGLLVAVFLGMVVTEWQRFFLSRRIRDVQRAAGEQLLRSTIATRLTGGAGMTGRLFLTDRRLVFVARPAVKEPLIWELALSDLTSTERFNRLGFIPTGLTLHTRRGDTFHFLIGERSLWEREIRRYSNAH